MIRDDQRIIAEMPDGSVQVITIALWALLCLCRNSPTFDKAAAVAQLKKDGLGPREIQHALTYSLDVQYERAKLQNNPNNSPERVKGYMGWCNAANKGTVTSFEEAATLIMAKDWSHVNRWKIVNTSDVPNRRDNEAHSRFRNALRYDLTHDMGACRELLRGCARQTRDAKFNPKDPKIDAAKTPEDLLRLWPADASS